MPKITTNRNLFIRSEPSSLGKPVGVLFPSVTLACEHKVKGQDHEGVDAWYKLDDGAYIWGKGVDEHETVEVKKDMPLQKSPLYGVVKEHVAIRLGKPSRKARMGGYLLKGSAVKFKGYEPGQDGSQSAFGVLYAVSSPSEALYVKRKWITQREENSSRRRSLTMRDSIPPEETPEITRRANLISNAELKALDFPALWRQLGTGRGVKVAVLDGGFYHQDEYKETLCFDATKDKEWEKPVRFEEISILDNNHGTYCADVIVGNREGVTGLAYNSEVVLIKVADDDLTGFDKGHFLKAMKILSKKEMSDVSIISVSHTFLSHFNHFAVKEAFRNDL